MMTKHQPHFIATQQQKQQPQWYSMSASIFTKKINETKKALFEQK
jgi:hypothetical protein